MPPADSQPLISGLGLAVQIGNQQVLSGVELTLHERERVGLIGRNGSGKSTLLGILAGTLTADAGVVNRRVGLVTGHLPQEFALDETLTVRENIRRGAAHILALLHEYDQPHLPARRAADLEHQLRQLDGWNLDVNVAAYADALAVPGLDRGIAGLSGGERRRVALCRALVGRPDLLLLDEPTNHLDIAAIEWLEAFLARYPGTLLLVTHDRYFLERICTRLLELSFGQLYSHDGNYTDFVLAKLRRQTEAAVLEGKRQSFLRRELEWVRRGPKARTTKAEARLKQYDAVLNQAAPEEELDVELLVPPADKLGTKVLLLGGVTLTIAGRTLVRDLDLNLTQGMRLGIVGPNGAGKTTLLRVLHGDLAPTAGSVVRGDLTRSNYLDQQRLRLDNAKSVFEDVGEGKDHVWLGGQKLTLWTYLRRYLFTDERILTKVGLLSGGERNRVMLAKLLKYGGNVLLLDEPTNDLDLETLRVLEETLTAFGGCVVVVSHDRYFLNRVCTHILALDGQGGWYTSVGDYDYYLEKRPRPSATTSVAAAEPPAKTKPRKKLSWKEERELEQAEAAIPATEAQIAELEARFSQPDFYQQHGAKVAELTRQLDDLRAQLDQHYARWTELEERRQAPD